MALILQNSDPEGGKRRKVVVRVVGWWGVKGVGMGLRMPGFGSYHFLIAYFEGEQEASFLCDPHHTGPLGVELSGLAV